MQILMTYAHKSSPDVHVPVLVKNLKLPTTSLGTCKSYKKNACYAMRPGFDTRSGNILSFLLPLFQEGQLSVTGESMCTKYWLTA